MAAPVSSLPFGGAGAATTAAAGGVSAAEDASSRAAKPAFEDMVRRPAKPDVQAQRTAPGARDASARPHDRVDAGEGESEKTTARAADDKAGKANKTDTADDTDALIATALFDLPAPPFPPATIGGALAADPLGNPLLGGPLPGDATALAAGVPDALSGRNAGPALPGALPIGADTQADTAATPTAITTAAAADAQAKPGLQNLLSFASHLASGQIAAAVPDAVNLGRDIVDALRSDDGDAPAPTGHPLAGIGAAHAPLGLSRTETVNAMEAPSADLHGGHFDEDIGDAVRWMADQKIGHAHIKITPHDLGTVEIRLRLEGERVHADFASAQPEVRQALEGSLARLRDMLEQQGLQLAHAGVGQQHSQPSPSSSGRHDDDGPAAATLTENTSPRPVRMTALGLLDAYA